MEEQYQDIQPSVSDNQPRQPYQIQYTPSSQFGILVGMAFVGLILGNILALIPFLIAGVSPLRIPAAMGNPAYANTMRLVQIINSICLFLFPIWIFKRVVKPTGDFLHTRTQSEPKTWILVALIAFASMPVTDLMATLNHIIPLPAKLAKIFQQLEDNYDNQIMQLMQMHGIMDLIVSLFIVALLPAVLEELFFRGGVQNILIQWFKKPFLAILVTSVVFSAIHFSYYGFLPRAFLGLLLGYVYYWSKDLKLNIFIHFINNAVSVVTIYILTKRNELTSAKMNESLPWYLQIGGLAVFAILLTILYKSFQKQKSNSTII